MTTTTPTPTPVPVSAETPAKPWWRRLALPLIGGGLAGFLAATLFLNLVEIEGASVLGPSREIAGLVGVLYAFMGLSVLFGAFSPGLGARFLNVEDADELREQGRILVYSGVATILLGGALVLLAIAGVFVDDGFAAALALGLILVACILSVAMQRLTDELQRALSVDATTTAFYLLFVFGGGWSILAHVGQLAPPAPLDWLTMFAVTMLAGTFWQTGKRGLLNRGPN